MRDFTLKNLNDDFYQYGFFVVDQVTARYGFFQYRKMCVSFAEPYTTDSFFARTPVEFVVLFLRYQNLEKVFAFPVAVSICF